MNGIISWFYLIYIKQLHTHLVRWRPVRACELLHAAAHAPQHCVDVCSGARMRAAECLLVWWRMPHPQLTSPAVPATPAAGAPPPRGHSGQLHAEQ